MARRIPKSYDEITRQTVPDPDSSWRPTPEQVAETEQGLHGLDFEEQALRDRVHEALVLRGFNTSRIEVEITRDRVTLRGSVEHHDELPRIETTVATVEGVGEVVDWLVISPPA